MWNAESSCPSSARPGAARPRCSPSWEASRRRAVLRRTKIGFVFQFFNLAPYLNVEQNILVPVLLNGKGKRSVEKELDDLLSFVGLSDKRTAMPGRLSGGEQQRVAIARGLISFSVPTSSCSTSRRATWIPSIPRG